MPTCQKCRSFVTADFARVFGNNDGDVFGCTDCTPLGGRVAGKSANHDR